MLGKVLRKVSLKAVHICDVNKIKIISPVGEIVLSKKNAYIR